MVCVSCGVYEKNCQCYIMKVLAPLEKQSDDFTCIVFFYFEMKVCPDTHEFIPSFAVN